MPPKQFRAIDSANMGCSGAAPLLFVKDKNLASPRSPTFLNVLID